MTVVVLSNCPPRLRGDLTKWMIEVNTNVYVGQFSARVRDELWQRVCENVKNGQATMVFSANGEQKMDFRVHNTTWEPADFDGIKLMLRPSPEYLEGKAPAKPQRTRGTFQRRNARRSRHDSEKLAVLDIETTGLSYTDDRILEIGALRVEDDTAAESFQALIAQDKPVPASAQRLTGITEQMLRESGVPLREALLRLEKFLEDRTLICQNGVFDLAFLQYACQRHQVPVIRNHYLDTRVMARRQLRDVADYKLGTLAAYFSIDYSGVHRALRDCELTLAVYRKLKEIERRCDDGS